MVAIDTVAAKLKILSGHLQEKYMDSCPGGIWTWTLKRIKLVAQEFSVLYAVGTFGY